MLFNTGVTASGAQAASGTNDLHFKITELGSARGSATALAIIAPYMVVSSATAIFWA